MDLITEVRQIRAEMNVPPAARPSLVVLGAAAQTLARLARHESLLLTVGRLSEVVHADILPNGAAQFVIGEATGALAITDHVDFAAERARLTKEIAAQESDITRTAKKLDNPDFVAKAPGEVIEENRDRLAAAQDAKAKLLAALARLEALA